VDLRDTPEEAAFRDEVKAWIGLMVAQGGHPYDVEGASFMVIGSFAGVHLWPFGLCVGGSRELAEAMARAGPVAQLVALSTNLGRQVPVVADPVELAEHLRWHGPDIHAMAKELSDYGEDKVHPPLAAHWPRHWASVDWPVGVGRGVLKPGHERSKPLS